MAVSEPATAADESDLGATLAVGLAAGIAHKRDALVVVAFALCATAVAGALSLVARSHTEAAAARLGERLGQPVTLGSADVDLSGAFTIDDVRIGQLASAERVEAGLALSSLMAGRLSPDEIRVTRPRLAVTVQADGTTDLGALADRVRQVRAALPHGTTTSDAPRPLRRIVVEGGRLEVSLGALGSLSAEGVELRPEGDGLRVITGALDAEVQARGVRARARFAQVGADLSPQGLRPTRAALADGHLTLESAGAAPLELDDVVLGLGTSGPGLSLDARHESGPVRFTTGRDASGQHTYSLSTTRLPLGALASWAPTWLHLGDTSVAGDLLVTRSADRLTARGNLDIDGLVVDHPLLAQVPVPLAGHLVLDGEAGAHGGQGQLALRVGATSFTAKGRLELGDDGRPRLASLSADLAPVACADALAALPAPLAGPLGGLMVEGRVAAHLGLEVDVAHLDDLELDWRVDNSCVVVTDGPGANIAGLARGGQHTLPDGKLRDLSPSSPGFAAIADLPDHVADAFVAGEDARFFKHTGFDAEQMRLSLIADLESGSVVRGGSTISQQLAKNLFLGRERTFARKLIEAILAWRLESALDKERLLEIYLNVIELGPGVYGIEAASQAWFGIPARQLDVAQAAFLAALTPAPGSLSRSIAKNHGLDERMRERVQIIVRSMRRNHLIGDERAKSARREVERLEVRVQTVE